jgi:hypothetical protein
MKETFERVQPCADCDLQTLPRDENGHPRNGECEYFRLPNLLWNSIAGDARFLCVGCAEQRLGRRLVWQDFLIMGEDVTPGNENVVGRPVWCDTSQFDSPRLAKRKSPGPSRGQQKQDSILIVKTECVDFEREDP